MAKGTWNSSDRNMITRLFLKADQKSGLVTSLTQFARPINVRLRLMPFH